MNTIVQAAALVKVVSWALMLDIAKKDLIEWEREIVGMQSEHKALQEGTMTDIIETIRGKGSKSYNAVLCSTLTKYMSRRYLVEPMASLRRHTDELTEMKNRGKADWNDVNKTYKTMINNCHLMKKRGQDFFWDESIVNTWMDTDVNPMVQFLDMATDMRVARTSVRVYRKLRRIFIKCSRKTKPTEKNLAEEVNKIDTWLTNWSPFKREMERYLAHTRAESREAQRMLSNFSLNYWDQFLFTCYDDSLTRPHETVTQPTKGDKRFTGKPNRNK